MNEPRPGDAFRPGDLLNNTYRIEALLGRGGTSEVYRARSEISGRVVALKALRSEFSRNEDFLLLMTREEEMRDIRHDAVVRYSDNQRTTDGTVYLVMDYVDGPDLDRKLRDGGMSAEDLIVIGGRVAEELTFGKENITSGASSDIQQATKLARAMVTQWGFSDELGQVAYGENQQEVFLGHSVTQSKNISEATAQKIDNEVRRLIDEAYTEARRILTEKHDDFVTIAEGLLEYETLSGDEIKALIRGDKPARDLGDDTPQSRGSSVPKTGTPKGGQAEAEGGFEPQPQ